MCILLYFFPMGSKRPLYFQRFRHTLPLKENIGGRYFTQIQNIVFGKDRGQILPVWGADTSRRGGRYLPKKGQILPKNTPPAQYLCGSDFSVLFSTISTISLPAPALKRAGL